MRTCSTHELVLNSPTYNRHIGNTNGEPSSYSAESKSGRLSQQIEARQSSTQTALPTQVNGLLNDIDEY